eukprot:CAMPEP_0201116384 /NCGR_PEP_ID=MMETSP0850-20130426/691_1 /ASSEMBLY_ACC=CAM_ASM_000622 /TAXON_ID=183588 /ORGANISM="Pseudo-nitzschia fraudulenta, Strain WWA7" /LENGTH=224 /DNA_ID=CAMNT_0047380455 /DNA_START=68 /DNA_END=742 /DNA_ORIENTATION=-
MTTMITFFLKLVFLVGACAAFQPQPLSSKATTRELFRSIPLMMGSSENGGDVSNDQRRKFLATSCAAAATGLFSFRQSAMAIPMASVDEFNTILRDSPLSVQIVEFSGPRSETVVVKLLDGTVFGIKDIIESPSDPRSPLKVVASCREANVKTKFVDLEAILAGSPKKKKMYTNERVQKAYELQQAQKERIRLDELDRLAQVEAQERAADAAAAESAATPAVTE